MNIQDLGSWGDLIAAIATVATLGYLAVQIKLNTTHSRAYTQRDILNENAADSAKGAKMPALIRRGLSDFSSLTNDEKIEFSDFLLGMTVRFEASLRLHKSGLVDEPLFIAHRGWLLAWLITPGGLEWWDGIRTYYSEDVREYINDAVDNQIDLPPPITETMPFYGLIDGE